MMSLGCCTASLKALIIQTTHSSLHCNSGSSQFSCVVTQTMSLAYNQLDDVIVDILSFKISPILARFRLQDFIKNSLKLNLTQTLFKIY